MMAHLEPAAVPAEGSRAQSTSGSIHNLQGATSEVAASNEFPAPQPSLPSQPNRQPSTAHTGAPPGDLHCCPVKASSQHVHLPIPCHEMACMMKCCSAEVSHSLH